jgi:ARG/rhodanese/phosphatase superfamily protein
MRIRPGLVAGVLLAGLSLACSLSNRIVEAKIEKSATGQSSNRVAIKATANPLHPAWRIGEPASFNNLTVFAVVSDAPTSATEFITLDEGLRSGKVIVKELGSRRARRGRQSSDDAEVNKLAVTNRSGKMLVLIAGELIAGGKQDRIVGHDCIIGASNKPTPIDVYCVEHGRWSGESNFGQSRSMSGGDGPSMGGGTPAGIIAMPNVRAKAQAEKSQSGVWNEVAKAQTENAVETDTGDLTSVYRDRRVTSKVSAYERAFKNKLSANNVVGAVVAVGGRVIAADVFANHSLFQAYWPKMLKSYALEAMNAPQNTMQEVARDDAAIFLTRVDGESESNGERGVYRLAENQSNKEASFELEASAKKPALIHFNRVSKQ